MPKLTITLQDASLDIEGSDTVVAEASRRFHLAVAELRLRDVDARLATLSPLQAERDRLQEQIATLNAQLANPADNTQSTVQ